MSTHAAPRASLRRAPRIAFSRHSYWLAAAYPLAFLVPFVLADRLGIGRDLFYGLYAAGVALSIAAWAADTGYDLRAAARRRWPWALGLGLAGAAVLAPVVVRAEEATARPDGLELAGAVVWRGLVYGADGLLLSVFRSSPCSPRSPARGSPVGCAAGS